MDKSGVTSMNHLRMLVAFALVWIAQPNWAAELKYAELLFKCRMEKQKCSSRSVCTIEVYGYPKDGKYLNPFVTLYQAEEKNIKDSEFIYDTKIALPASYEVASGRYTFRVDSPEFPLRFSLEIQVNAEKPELASTGLFREKDGSDSTRYYCRQLKAGLDHK